LYDIAMQRWGVPFHVIEREWSDAQFFGLLTAARENQEQVNGGGKVHHETISERAARLIRERQSVG
jgi:hypothetical protein